MKTQAHERLKANFTIDQKLQRLNERRTGKPYSGTDYVPLTAGRNTGTGAGVLFYAADTGRMLFLQRSAEGDCAGTWCGPGGGVEDYETIDQAVRRETQEEVGYDGQYDLIHLHRDVHPDGYTFHNHMAVVPTEFEPRLNGEHTAYVWADEMPEPIHPGLGRSIEQWNQRQAKEDENLDQPRD